VLPDKRRRHTWYLIDQHGKEHLAVSGEEKEPKCSHYHYTAVGRCVCSSVRGRLLLFYCYRRWGLLQERML